jgi:hypothetical protein
LHFEAVTYVRETGLTNNGRAKTNKKRCSDADWVAKTAIPIRLVLAFLGVLAHWEEYIAHGSYAGSIFVKGQIWMDDVMM